MKIKKMRLDYWGEHAGKRGKEIGSGELFRMSGYANSPSLRLLVDESPRNDMVYQRKKIGDSVLYYGERNGYVRFLCHDPRQESGYGGDLFRLRVCDEDGIEEEQPTEVKGPWSSRAGVMNSYGFGPCVDASITDDPGVWARGFTFHSGAVTLRSVLDFLETGQPEGLPHNFQLHFVIDDDGAYVPVPMKLGVNDRHGRIFPLPELEGDD